MAASFADLYAGAAARKGGDVALEELLTAPKTAPTWRRSRMTAGLPT